MQPLILWCITNAYCALAKSLILLAFGFTVLNTKCNLQKPWKLRYRSSWIKEKINHNRPQSKTKTNVRRTLEDKFLLPTNITVTAIKQMFALAKAFSHAPSAMKNNHLLMSGFMFREFFTVLTISCRSLSSAYKTEQYLSLYR